MSLDACFLTFLTRELDQKLTGTRAEKISMPSRDETVFTLKGASGRYRLLFNASTGCPRVCLTTDEPENPAVPPAFCMLFASISWAAG